MNMQEPAAAARLDARWVASGLRARILGPTALALLVLIAVLAALILLGRSKANEDDAAQTAAAVEQTLREQTDEEVRTMQSVIELVMRDHHVEGAFRSRDRAALLALGRPILEQVRERNGISHLYFILPDGKVLLRVHAPDHDGDIVRRASLREAQRTGQPAWLNEQGPLGNFTLRVVYPWRANGELLGYIEMGLEFDHIVESIKRALQVDLFVALDKSRLNAAQWKAVQRQADGRDQWNEFPSWVLLTRTLQDLPDGLRRHLERPVVRGERTTFETPWGDRVGQLYAQPFAMGGEQVGQLVILQDITAVSQERRLSVLRVSAACAAVVGALMVFLHFLLGRVEEDLAGRTARLDEATRRLADEQHERQRAEQALAAQHERNEWLEARSRMVEELAAAHRKAQAALEENEAVTRTLRETQSQLVTAAREAGRAEIATNVLHNVGNVLSSVNVAAGAIGETLRNSRLKGLSRALGMVQEHRDDLGRYLAQDEKGRLLPGYLEAASESLGAEHAGMLEEVDRLTKSIDHIKDIVATQQTHATAASVVEPVSPAELAEQALRMQGSALARHQVTVVRRFDSALRPVPLDRSRILQILVNLISNAKVAMTGLPGDQHRMTVGIELTDGDGAEPARLRFWVEDEGEGIPAGNLTRIFAHGFTTRRTGHGFGLHSSAVAAGEMGGTLTAHSDGPGQGARFTLELPLTRHEAVAA